MENTEKLVDFTYCKTCKFQSERDVDEPCNECLSIPARDNSHRPINYKEAK